MCASRQTTTYRGTHRRDDAASVLVVDDDPEVVALAGAYLKRADGDVRVHTETDPRDALAAFEAGEHDCVVSDYEMPGMDGLALLEAVRERDADLPFVLFTAVADDRVAERARQRGATYVPKHSQDGGFEALTGAVEDTVASDGQ